MIDPITRDKIVDTAQIVDVIQDFVTLKKRGVNYLGLCPFHNEKTPSFTVSPAKGIFKCFGCGKGGNSVNFIMEHEQFSYPEALKYLAKKYGIEVEERELSDEEKRIGSERESLLIVTAFANRYFINQLQNSPEGIDVGLSYFKERKFSKTIIEDFQLGYCPDGKDLFTNEALRNGYKTEFLEKSGLSIFKDNYKADRFAGRVIFPIHSLAGKVIGFGGRTLKTEKSVAKYLNSPESSIYSKSKVLYGLFQAKKSIVKNDKCFLVEGYTDVISLHMSGVENVVASSGTSLTEDQIRLIQRFTQNITILFDGDEAGIKASLRGTDMILKQGMNVRVVSFPEGEDPDSFARSHSSSEFIEYINQNEEDFIRFKTKLLSKDAKNDPIKKAALISEVVKSIALIDNNIKQAVYIQDCSEFLNIEEKVIYSEIVKIRKKLIESERKSTTVRPAYNENAGIPAIPSYVEDVFYEVQEKEIIRLMLLYGSHHIGYYEESKSDITVAEYIINELRNDKLEIKNLVYYKVFNEVEALLLKGEIINESYFINHSDPEISQISADLCSVNYTLSKLWEKRGAAITSEDKQLTIVLQDVIIKYKLKITQLQKQSLQKQLREAVDNNINEDVKKIMLQIQRVIRIINTLSELQDRVIL